MSYKLIGSINPFNTVPSVLYVVFLGEDGKYYFGFDDEKSEKGIGYYDKFQQIPNETVNNIRYIFSTNNIFENVKKDYKIGDLAICGYEYDDEKVFFGRLDNYLEFLKKQEYKEKGEIDWLEPVVKKLNK